MSPEGQVFISYARDQEVSEQLAAELHAKLTQADILSFRDVEGLELGDHWADVLEKKGHALEELKEMRLINSPITLS
jgi:hypothetical protein